MNFKKMFGTKESITAGERAKLEQLDEAARPLREWRKKLPGLMPNHFDGRKDLVAAAAEVFAANPSEATFSAIRSACGWASNPIVTPYDYLKVDSAIAVQINLLLAPQGAIIREILKRLLSRVESQLSERLAREKSDSEAAEVPFAASGIVSALEQKVLNLRNRVSQETFADWRTELEELL
jgi:hypothetical protein